VPGQPPTPSKSFSAKLDFLRAVAVLCVFFAHMLVALGYMRLGIFGLFGVVLFFVHTSMVLMSSLERLESSADRYSGVVRAFWVRRFFRIYPLAVLFVLVAVICRVPIFPGFAYVWMGTKTFVSNLLLVQNLTYSKSLLSPMWSLPLEVQMYAVLPFAYLAVRGAKSYRSLVMWGVSVVLALVALRVSGRLNVFRYAPCFVSGIVAYDLVRARLWKRQLPAWLWPVSLLLLLALFGLVGNSEANHPLAFLWVVSLVLAVLYPGIREMKSGIVQKVCHWTAEHSYGIYLSHVVVFWVAIDRMRGLPLWMRVVVLVAAAIVVPALLYVWIERPFILLGSRIAGSLLRSPTPGRDAQLVRR
jgi:peptidoglycan/LPS O-acetylase OafA/YrhL